MCIKVFHDKWCMKCMKGPHMDYISRVYLHVLLNPLIHLDMSFQLNGEHLYIVIGFGEWFTNNDWPRHMDDAFRLGGVFWLREIGILVRLYFQRFDHFECLVQGRYYLHSSTLKLAN